VAYIVLVKEVLDAGDQGNTLIAYAAFEIGRGPARGGRLIEPRIHSVLCPGRVLHRFEKEGPGVVAHGDRPPKRRDLGKRPVVGLVPPFDIGEGALQGQVVVQRDLAFQFGSPYGGVDILVAFYKAVRLVKIDVILQFAVKDRGTDIEAGRPCPSRYGSRMLWNRRNCFYSGWDL